MKKLRLYIWTEFCPDWSDGIAFAVAESENEARAMIIKNLGFDPANSEGWGNLRIVKTNVKLAYAICGGA